MAQELFTLTANESNLSEVIAVITRLIEEKSARIFWFSGDLGAGKTTLIRSLVKYLGYPGIVGSPTYGLVNTYDLEDTHDDSNQLNVSNHLLPVDSGFQPKKISHKRVHHSDWYRIESIDELYDSGIEEELHEGNDIWLIEWAEMGLEVLKSLPVIKIEIEASSPTSPRTYRFLMV